MTTVLHPPEQRVLLDNITWDLYEDLLAAHRDRSVPHFTYDQGQLEIMSPSAEHEQVKETITLLINVVAEEQQVNIEIDITRPSINKFAILAHVGVPEVWRYDSRRLSIFRLQGAAYIEHEASVVLRGIAAADVTRFLDQSLTLERLAWLRSVRT